MGMGFVRDEEDDRPLDVVGNIFLSLSLLIPLCFFAWNSMHLLFADLQNLCTYHQLSLSPPSPRKSSEWQEANVETTTTSVPFALTAQVSIKSRIGPDLHFEL